MVPEKLELKDITVCVVGLGYVGLPLALAFGRTEIKTYGLDINSKRVELLKNGIDETGELTTDELKSSNLIYTDDEKEIRKANFIIVAVPTPVNKANQPDLTLVEKASEMVGRNMYRDSIVVYESTVYPGVTEDVCGPILESQSGFELGKDFKIGYSPERINPGDKEHTLEKIVKVVSGMDKESTKIISDVYSKVCLAGVHIASNIKTAEAAKVIENTQRDINMALMNELSLIFHRLGIDTTEVLKAAGTKWNFIKFTPGLVGGHCIGVDPYYLVHKAEETGYHPQVISAGRRVNDYMPEFVAEQTILGLIEAGKLIQKSNVLVMGLTFKENVKDIRNSKISATIDKLKNLGVKVYGYDPVLDDGDIDKEFGIPSVANYTGGYDAVIFASAHDVFINQKEEITKSLSNKTVFVDVRNTFPELKNNSEIIYKNL